MIQCGKVGHFAVATTLSLFVGIAAYADEVSFNFEVDNGTQSGVANFTFADGAQLGDLSTLTITLTNTMTSNPSIGNGPNWLAGLFFDLAGSPTLSYQSIDSQMITLDGTTQSPFTDYDPDQFWAYRDNLTGELPFGDQQYGLGD